MPQQSSPDPESQIYCHYNHFMPSFMLWSSSYCENQIFIFIYMYKAEVSMIYTSLFVKNQKESKNIKPSFPSLAINLLIVVFLG